MALIATSKNAVITFTSLVTGSMLLGGFSNENILAIPDVDIVKTTVGNDGQLNRSVIAKHIEGSFSFFPTSPTLGKIYTIQQAVYNTGAPINGVLTVTFPTSVSTYTFPEFSFHSGAKGIEAGEEQKPVTIKWSSLMPNYASLGALAAEAISLL